MSDLPLAGVLPVHVEAHELDSVCSAPAPGSDSRSCPRRWRPRCTGPFYHVGRPAGPPLQCLYCCCRLLKADWKGTEVFTEVHMVTLTDIAATKVKELMNGQAESPETGLRVAVRGGGCSGFQYALAFDEQREGDQIFEHAGHPPAGRLREPPVRRRLRGRLRRGPSGRRLRGEQPERRRSLRLRPVVQNGLAN